VKHETPIDLDKLRSLLNSVVAPWVAELVARMLRMGRKIVFGEITSPMRRAIWRRIRQPPWCALRHSPWERPGSSCHHHLRIDAAPFAHHAAGA
jgi:hypothetical protein